MARNTPIKKLARQLGRRTEEIVQIVHDLGHPRYGVGDVLPGELVDQVRAAADKNTFEQLMRAQGVRRMGDGGRAPDRQAPPRSPAARRAPPASRASPHPAPSPPHRRPSAPVRSVGTDPDLLEALDRAREQIGAYASQIEALEDQLRALEARERAWESMEADVMRLQAELANETRELDACKAERLQLHRRLLRFESGSAGIESANREATLNTLFSARGLMGQDESRRAVQALLDSWRWEEMEGWLWVDERSRVERFLQHRLVLHCARDTCPVPRGKVPVRVIESRCEVCGGSDLTRAVLHTGEAFLLNGLTHVAIVGGASSFHPFLRENMDERIDLQLYAGKPGPRMREHRAKLQQTRFVVIWGEILEDDRAWAQEHLTVPWLAIDFPGMGRMLEMVAEHLSDPDWDSR